MKEKLKTAVQSMKIWQKTALLVALPLTFQLFVIAGITRAEQELEAANREERDCDRVAALTTDSFISGLDALRDMVAFGTNNRADIHRRFNLSVKKMEALRLELVRYHNPFVSQLDEFIGELKAQMIKLDAERKESRSIDDTMTSLSRVSRLTTAISRLTKAMLEAQQVEQAKTMIQLERKKQQFDNTVLIGLASTIAFSVFLALLYNWDTLNQLKILGTNADRFGRGVALLPAIEGSGELAQLDRVFHAMADSLNTLTERERAIFRNSSELIFVVDEKLKVAFVSDASERILQRHPDDLLGMQAIELSRDIPEQLSNCKRAGDLRFETQLSRADRRAAEVEVSAHWSESEKSFYCVAHDIAERKELERMKQSFLAMVTHDLRSPITANMAGLQLLENDKTLSQSSQRIVERMQSSNSRLIGLINDLLDMEKLNAGLMELELEMVSFNDLVSETLSMLEALAADKQINLIKDDNDTLIYCDSGRMVQVIANILSNAIKFSPPGASIEIGFAESSVTTIVSVTDHGPGIPDDFVPHLFDQFSQTGDKSSKRQGSGLGLAISKKLVGLHHGEIRVETELGAGTCFRIELPKPKAGS